jgi:iron complex transport system permease protein
MRAWLVLGVTLAVAIVIAACAGHDWVTPADLWRAIEGDRDLRSRLLFDWRLPRVLAAALVGALLGLGGAIFQGVFRNPLAEPYLLGSAGGAALGATVALLVPLAIPQSLLLPVLAFAGAWGATLLVLGIARVAGAVDAAGLLLAGVAVAAILGALRSFMMLALSDETVSLQVVLSWVLGGVQTPTWSVLGLLALISLACLGLTMLLARRLDVLGLGETMASMSGASSRLPCSRARSWSRPPSLSAASWPSWDWQRLTSRAGSSGRCTSRCCRPRRWLARSS